MPTVELRFTALPEHVRTARLVAVSLARRAGIGDDILDEVRLAVGEAAARAVTRHLAVCPDEPVLVTFTDGSGAFVAAVVDVAGTDVPPTEQLVEGLPAGVELAVISGLVDDVALAQNAAGSTVTMTWASTGNTVPAGPVLGQAPPPA